MVWRSLLLSTGVIALGQARAQLAPPPPPAKTSIIVSNGKSLDGWRAPLGDWKLAKAVDGAERLGTVLYCCVEGLRIVSILLEPALPSKVKDLRQSLALPGGDLEATRQ